MKHTLLCMVWTCSVFFTLTAKEKNDFPNLLEEINMDEPSAPKDASGRVRFRPFSNQRFVLEGSPAIIARQHFTAAEAKNPLHLLDSVKAYSLEGRLMSKTTYKYNSKGEIIEKLEYALTGEPFGDAIPNRIRYYDYDEDGNLTYYKSENWNKDNQEWEPNYWVEFTFYSPDYYSSEIGYQWDKDLDDWVGWYKVDYEYLSEGKVTETINYEWVQENQTWVNSSQYLNHYNNQENLTEQQHYIWDDETEEWTIYKKDVYSLDDNGNAITRIHSQHLSGDEWWNRYKYEYINEAGYRINEEYFAWDDENENWAQSSSKVQYDYDEYGHKILRVSYSRDVENESWIGNNKSVNSFTEGGKPVVRERYSWDLDQSDWRGLGPRIVSEYNSEEKLIKHQWWDWNVTDWEWSIIDHSDYYLDENGFIEYLIHAMSPVDSEVLTNDFKINYFRNKFGKTEYTLKYFWDENVSDWEEEYNEKTDYYYTDIKGTQVITFEELADTDIKEGSFELQASISSGLEITYESVDPSIATVEGNEVTLHDLGTTTITASQDGNDEYEAATAVSQELTVIKITTVEDRNGNLISDIAPNPVKGAFGILNSDIVIDEVAVFDLNGVVVKRFVGDQKVYHIDELSEGVYQIRISSANTILTRKIIKL